MGRSPLPYSTVVAVNNPKLRLKRSTFELELNSRHGMTVDAIDGNPTRSCIRPPPGIPESDECPRNLATRRRRQLITKAADADDPEHSLQHLERPSDRTMG